MADIYDFLEEFRGEYELAKRELDVRRASNIALHQAAGGLDLSLFPDYFFGPSEKNRKILGGLGMPVEEIMDLEIEMQRVACEIPAEPDCLSYKNVLDFVDGSASELENKSYYEHLLLCRNCRQDVFANAWFMLEP